MAKPGAAVRQLRLRLKNNVDVTMKQLAWNILAYSRRITEETAISKGTTLASWVIGVGHVNSWVAPTHYEPYSWYEGNEIRNRYAGLVRQSYSESMKVTFSVPFFVSNSTPYLFESVNTNPEFGGTNEDSTYGENYAEQLSAFAKSEAHRLFSTMPIDRMLYQGIVL